MSDSGLEEIREVLTSTLVALNQIHTHLGQPDVWVAALDAGHRSVTCTPCFARTRMPRCTKLTDMPRLKD